ncbi:ABC transporter permease [Sedimentibacter sp. MB31-C6]|uniref:ABC transporter permease n=1 Tax=Sedimentibacter sp. MB31-C6 TaxID=3109366 RepID=UPI002DDD5891|nr:ABC transporter permease [Sedimentibacter sp. MB36-C1]WSI03436.1 ABC transporter permease [Sedimentibacter sp. MB36-C1]
MILEAFLSPDFFNAALRATTPILFATLASAVAVKAGIINMALEGIMLFSALFGVVFSSLFHSAWLGLFATMILGGFIGLFLAFFVLRLKTDEILAAIAINLIANGATVLLLLTVSGDRGVSSSIKSIPLQRIAIPVIENIPFLGEVISNQNILTYISLIMVVIVHIFLYKTPLGLRIRAVGENKDAAESVGISSRKIQYIALMISGILASMGGFFLSGGYMTNFTTGMSAGRGFIALAASAMGGNTPIGGFLVSLLFGAAQALANILQLGAWPHELIQMLPYVTTLVGLGIYSYLKMKKMERLSGK